MTRTVKIGNLDIGGRNPVRVESMLTVPVTSREECLGQCEVLGKNGCELIRAAFPSKTLSDDLSWLIKNSSVPLMADIHFDAALALAALEAGSPSIRINPGNMARGISDVVACARERGAVIRIGANSGSLNAVQLKKAGGVRSDALAAATEEQLRILLDHDFYEVILSAKSTSAPETVRANTLLALKYPEFPFHIGITESGFGRDGLVKSAAGLALLLAQGIGSTIRISLSEPPEEEVKAGYSLLRALELRHRGGSLISCPTCGRKRIDVMEIAKNISPCLGDLPDGTTVAVMGCEVNGPREAMDADFGIAGSPGGAVIFRKGRVLREVSLADAANTLAEMAKSAPQQ